MANFRRRRIDVEDEKKILISMIVSTSFLKEIIPILKPEYFKVPYSKRIFKWIKTYFDKYQEAPGRHIQDLYQTETDAIDNEEAELLASFLEELSNQYDETFNEAYILDKAIVYLKKQALDYTTTRVKSFLELGQVAEAEMELESFRKVAKATSGWVNPHDPDFITKVFKDDRDTLIKFPGALGELFGFWDRGWLVAVQAGYNIGKTFFLQEVRLQGLLGRLRVAEINLEMSSERLARRHYKRIMAASEHGGTYLYPVFDCHYNQTGECTDRARINKVKLFDGDCEDLPKRFQDGPKDYLPCTACRGEDNKFRLSWWWTQVERKAVDEISVKKKSQAIDGMYGGNFRLKCYPRFSANLQDIQRDLDLLEYSEGFIPDIIIIDYADILRPESNRDSNEEGRLNETWMTLAKMAAERHCLVVTATQIKTDALKRQHAKMGDASGSARAKYAHTDFVFGLTATNEEKMRGIRRINVIKNRDGDFNELEEVVILQQLQLGQGHIDSEFSDDFKFGKD